MELSLSPSSALRFPDIRAYRSVSSQQTKITTIKQAGKFYYPSSISKCSQTSLPSSILFYPTRSGSKLAPHESHRSEATPLVRAYNAQLGTDESDLAPPKKNPYINVVLKFIRPFAIVSILVQFTSVLARTWIHNSHLLQWSNWSIPIKTLAAIVSLLCASFYTNGINQIFDVEIDKINKPDLPIASGALPMESAWLLVMSYVAISLLAAGVPNSGTFLASICAVFFVSTMYSVPPLRTKTSTFGAFLTIGLMQGFVHFLCVYAAARATLGLPFQLSLPVIFMSIFTTVFSLTMGILKDIPDVEGDKRNNIPTIATIIGVRKTLFLGVGIHLLNHVGAILVAVLQPQAFRRGVMIPAHILLALYLIVQAWRMEKANYDVKISLEAYLCIWRIFLAQFLLFPFI